MSINELSVQGMLCDFAEVSGGKLFISGAGINLIASPVSDGPPYPVNVALALLVRIPWTATNQQHKLKVDLLSDSPGGGPTRVPINAGSAPEGNEEDQGTILALFTAGRSPNMQAGEESLMPVALPMPGVPLPVMGSYYFSIFIDGTELDRVSFRVTSMANAMAPFGRVA